MENKTSPIPLPERQDSLKKTIARILFPIALGTILAAAAYLRLWGLEHSSTGGDQAVLLNIALRWVTQGKFPLAANKSSVGLMNPPLLEYLLALPLFLRRDMVWVARFVALLNLASVAITCFILKPIFGRRMALLATLLYAVNPWSVYYSRLIWNPTMIPLFSTLLLGSLLAAFAKRRKTLALISIFVWLAAAIQLHLASLALLPAVGVIFWIFRHKLAFKPLLAGVLLFTLTFAPFYIYEQQTGFMDLTDFRQATGGAARVNLSSVAIGIELAQAKGIWHTLGATWSQWHDAAAWGEWLAAGVPWLLLAGFVVAGWRLFHRRDEFTTRQFAPKTTGLVVIVTLAILPLLFYLRHTAYLQTYYFLYLYPLPFIIMALAADAAISWSGPLASTRWRVIRPLAWIPAILIVALAGWQFFVNHTALQLLSRELAGERQIWHVQQVIDTFAAWSESEPDCDLVIASNGYNAESSTLGQVGEFLAPHPVRYVSLNKGAIIPRTCAFYLVAADDTASRDWYQTQTTHLAEQTIRLANDAWHFYQLAPPAREALIGKIAAPQPLGEWENGVRLQRYEITGSQQPGSALKLALTWQVYDTPPKQRFHFFNHLVDKKGTLAAQTDGPGVYSRYWQPGEFFITWFDLTLPAEMPPDTYQLLVGLYDWPSLERPHLTDGRDSLPLTFVEITTK